MHPELEPLLDPALLERLAERPLDEIRAHRAACQALEDRLSYQRRVAHARLDLIRSERARRADAASIAGPAPMGLGEGTDDELVARLAGVLADHTRGSGLGQAPRDVRFPELDAALTDPVDAALDPVRLVALGEATDDELTAAEARVAALEAEVSADRHALHGCIDALSTEITRRYRTGEASVDALLD